MITTSQKLDTILQCLYEAYLEKPIEYGYSENTKGKIYAVYPEIDKSFKDKTYIELCVNYKLKQTDIDISDSLNILISDSMIKSKDSLYKIEDKGTEFIYN